MTTDPRDPLIPPTPLLDQRAMPLAAPLASERQEVAVRLLGALLILQGVPPLASTINRLLAVFMWAGMGFPAAVIGTGGFPQLAASGVIGVLAVVAGVLLIRRHSAGRSLGLAASIGPLVAALYPVVRWWLLYSGSWAMPSIVSAVGMVLSGIATAAVYVYFLAPPSLFVAWRRYVPLPDVLAASPAMPPLAPEDSPAHAWRAPDPVTVLGVVFVLQGITHSVSFVNGLLQTYLALWSNISWSVSAAAGDPNTVLILALHAVPGVLAILALVAAVLLLRRRPAGRILAIASAIAGLLIPVLPYVVIWLVRMPRVFVLEGLASHIRQATTLLVGLGTAAVYIYFLTRPVVREACAGSAWKAAA